MSNDTCESVWSVVLEGKRPLGVLHDKVHVLILFLPFRLEFNSRKVTSHIHGQDPRSETGIEIAFMVVHPSKVRDDCLAAIHRVTLKIELIVGKD
jgi:hypothetical protein